MKSLNDIAWEKIFDKYNILDAIQANKNFIISSKQIKEFREPRLMTKFDHKESLPEIFTKNNLSILPISRGDYIISNHQIFKKMDDFVDEIHHVELPSYIESLDIDNITSEAIALNCSYISGILDDFLEDEDIVPTVSGRMSSKNFKFLINNKKSKDTDEIEVNNSQIEIDGAYEGINYLTLIEAKREISEDFLIRQLYYPYRLWANKIAKPIKLVYLIYSNEVFSLFEYKFDKIDSYNSIKLVKQKNYSLEDVKITTQDIEEILGNTEIIDEPNISFPQADNFRRVINMCEFLKNEKGTKDIFVERYNFEPRQSDYYTNACRYLGLIDKIKYGRNISYQLTQTGKNILKMNYAKRQLAFIKQIVKHNIFNQVLRISLSEGCIPDKNRIVDLMKENNLYKVVKDDTFERRASTVSRWIYWIISTIQE